MKIKQLFKGIAVCIKGNKELVITGICSHSSRVMPGNLFVARKGSVEDGADYISEAKEAGAKALLVNSYYPFLRDLTQVIVPDVKEIESIIVNRYYEYPTKKLFLIGITGTNGKTTTSYLVKHLLEKESCPCGLIGTIEYHVGKYQVPAMLTTPDIITSQGFFRKMVDQGVKSAVIEVSSHALDQDRVAGMDFDSAIFTNLSQDHLDYHHTMEKYLAAKKKLLPLLDQKEKVVFVNADEEAFSQGFSLSAAEKITYGIKKEADLKGEILETNLQGTKIHISFREHSFFLFSPLLGLFNVYNLLPAIGIALLQGEKVEHIVSKVAIFPGIPGRLEALPNELGISFFVDFAHTPDALQKVLHTLKRFATGRVIAIMGAGGNRDRGKRKKIGKVLSTYADKIILTSDNPRTEDPEKIIAEIAMGIDQNFPYSVKVDRREAIRAGIRLSQKNDILLLAGRGHEFVQQVGNRSVPFDDREIASEELASFPQLR